MERQYELETLRRSIAAQVGSPALDREMAMVLVRELQGMEEQLQRVRDRVPESCWKRSRCDFGLSTIDADCSPLVDARPRERRPPPEPVPPMPERLESTMSSSSRRHPRPQMIAMEESNLRPDCGPDFSYYFIQIDRSVDFSTRPLHLSRNTSSSAACESTSFTPFPPFRRAFMSLVSNMLTPTNTGNAAARSASSGLSTDMRSTRFPGIE